MTRALFLLMSLLFTSNTAYTQKSDEEVLFIKSIHEHILSHGNSYRNLRQLCKKAGGRLAGSEAYNRAIEISKKQLQLTGADTIYTQECITKGWLRGEESSAYILEGGAQIELSVTSLGFSGATEGAICGNVVRFMAVEDIKQLAPNALDGKIAFLDRPFDSSLVNTFSAYGKAVDQRVFGPDMAAQKGAIATIVRSMTSLYNHIPHTGVTLFSEDVDPIPALAISLNDADMLAEGLTSVDYKVCVSSAGKPIGEVSSYNVIGEIKGSISPDTILLVGGHLDSWDIGEGAHDDGAGCVQAIEVIEALLSLEYKPRYTIRCVLFANEESGLAGGRKYAEIAKSNNEFHLAAMESDRGGFTPRGFTCDGNAKIFKEKFTALNGFEDLLTSYNLYIKKGGAGADISPLKDQNTLLIGFKPDSQRYFDYHHASNDTFETVNERELKLGAAAMASLIYLIDKNGL